VQPGKLVSRLPQTPTLDKFTHDIPLQPDNIVHLWCKTVQFLAVIFGWNEVIFTQQSQVYLRPPRRKSTKGFIQKMSAGHSFIAPENLSGFQNSAVRKCQKTNIQPSLIPMIYMTS
jgi:hypothetical protein